jgi:predicted MFS family arabinose efflux permease
MNATSSRTFGFGALCEGSLLNILHFCNDGLQASFLLLLPFVAADVCLSTLQVGLLTAVHFLMSVLLAVPAGVAARRHNGLSLLLGGAALCGGCFLAMPIARDFWSAGLIYLLAGVGYGIFHPIALGLVARRAAPRAGARSMGWFTLVGDIGRVVVPGLVLGILPLVGWTVAAGGTGLATILLATSFFVWRGEQQQPAAAADPTAERAEPARVVDVLRQRPFLWACVIGFFDALANSSLYVFLPALVLVKGFGTCDVGLFVAVFFAASLTGRVCIGRVADRLGKVRSLALCQLAIAATIGGMCLGSHVLVLGLCVACLGMLSKGSLPVYMSMTSQRLPRGAVQVGFGINQMVLGVAVALSPLLLGWVCDHAGVTGAFATAGVLGLLTAAMTLLDLHWRPLANLTPAPQKPKG